MNQPQEKRRWRRFERIEPLVYLLGGDRVEAEMKDISLGGAFLRSSRTPDVGQAVEFALRGRKPGSPVIVAEGEVIRNFSDKNVGTDQWGFGLSWSSLRSPGGPLAVKSLFDEISGEFPAVQRIPTEQKPTTEAFRGGFPNGAVAVWIRGKLTWLNDEMDCIVSRLGSQRIEVKTLDYRLPPDSSVTVIMDGAGQTDVRILGRVLTTFHNDDGGRSDIKVIYREDMKRDG